MLTKGKILNEFFETIGTYWYRPSMGRFTLRLYGVNRDGYTEEGIIAWCLTHDCYWEES